jgi:restriction endonuclease S subunit
MQSGIKTIVATLVFDCMSGNSGLTEEFIYTKLATKGTIYEVLSSSTTGMTRLGFIPMCVLNNEKILKVFEEKHGILVARNGKAGQMTYLKPGNYTINDHAYILSLRDDFKISMGLTLPEGEQKFLLWFICVFQQKVYEFASKTDNATWNKSDFLKLSISMPQKEEIECVARIYDECLKIKERVNVLLSRINSLKKRALLVDYQKYQVKDSPVSNILDCYGGNTGLTEKEIYQTILTEGQRYKVLSASTSEETQLGSIPKVNLNGRELEVLEDKEGILVIRKGKAGITFYHEKGKYTLTDDAYFLTIKESCEYDISLKWLISQYRQIFFEYSSSSDNGTWNMTGFFKNVKIDIPSYEEQLELVKTYDYLESLQTKIEGIQVKIAQLFTRQIVT